MRRSAISSRSCPFTMCCWRLTTTPVSPSAQVGGELVELVTCQAQVLKTQEVGRLLLGLHRLEQGDGSRHERLLGDADDRGQGRAHALQARPRDHGRRRERPSSILSCTGIGDKGQPEPLGQTRPDLVRVAVITREPAYQQVERAPLADCCLENPDNDSAHRRCRHKGLRPGSPRRLPSPTSPSSRRGQQAGRSTGPRGPRRTPL